MLDFSRLPTPPQHGDVLIEPPPSRPAQILRENQALLRGYRFDVLDQRFATARQTARAALGLSGPAPWIVLGHQPEFLHAGVWAKHVVAAALARRHGGMAVHLVVDSDAPRDTLLQVPETNSGRRRWRSFPFPGHVPGLAFECLPSTSRGTLTVLEARMRAALGEGYTESLIPALLRGMNEVPAEADWVDQVLAGQQAVGREVGVALPDRRISRVWLGSWTADWVLNADRLMESYNASLAKYRLAQGIRHSGRPIPDLERRGDRRELPLWVYPLGRPRRRLFCVPSAEAVELFAEDDRVGLIPRAVLSRGESAGPALAALDGYVLRPRALMLTAWARLFVADLFVHGIGGAKYDRITDELIRRYYGVEPPAYLCVSATMFLDGRRAGEASVHAREAKRQLRDVRYNPQRFLEPSEQTAATWRERAEAVGRSAILQARWPRDRDGRRRAFEQIRSANDRLMKAYAATLTPIREAARASLASAGDGAAARRREFYFGYLSRGAVLDLRDKLVGLVDESVSAGD